MIRSSNFFWGGILILLGGLFLVDSLGIMEINLWGVFWPLMLILFGLWVLLGYFKRGSPVEAEESAIPLEGARKATIHLNHGAGRLVLRSGAGPMELISGSFGGGLSTKTRQQLTDEIPLDIRLNTGASDTRLDLTDLQVTNLRIETGASATEIQLPDGVAYTKVIVKAGAASVNLKVPENVAARVRVSGGLMGATVDRERFPKSGGTYQSLDYEIALHKVEIYANVGVGSVTVR
jgi:molybdopterin-binding protein